MDSNHIRVDCNNTDNLKNFGSDIMMDDVDISLNIVMFVSTIVLVLYGLTKGFDTVELTINAVYFSSLILYLFRINFLKG